MSEDENYRRPRELHIKVDSKQMEDMLERLKKTEAKLEQSEVERDDAVSKLSIIAEQKMNEKRESLKRQGYEGELNTLEDIQNAREWEKENRNNRIEVGKGGSGQIGIEGNLGNKNEESWDSYESMVFALAEQKHSENPQVRERATKILDELWKKNLAGIKSGDLPRKIYDENEPQFKDQPSILKKALNARNERLRKRMLKEREK